jgi:hypothetical protein
VVYKDENREVTLVFLDIYHRLEGYESDNAETYKVLDKVMGVIESKGIWTMDRGYNNHEIMRYSIF